MSQQIKVRVNDLEWDRAEPAPPALDTAPRSKMTFIARTLGAVAGWALFIYWWSIVLKPPMASRAHIELLFLEILTVIVFVICGAFYWIHHNLAIARVGHRGAVCRYVPPVFERDYFGRTLTLPPRAVLFQSSVISILTETNKKTYRVGIPWVEPALKSRIRAIKAVPVR